MSQGHVHTIQRLSWSIALNLLITLAEFIGGIVSGSLALVADAVHNFIDTSSLFISLIAYKMSLRVPNLNYTYGYRRIGILASLFNLSLLFGVSLFLFKEAIERLFHPRTIDIQLMLSIAVIGLFANILTGILLFKDAKKSFNIKSAYLHILADALSSVGVIIAGIIIFFTNFYQIDAIFTFVIASYIFYISIHLGKKVLPILMQCVPSTLNLEEIGKVLRELPEVEDVHHLHLWNLDEHEKYFEAHIRIKTDSLWQIERIKRILKDTLKKRFGIYHSTLEFEIESCEDTAFISNHEDVPKIHF